jgi:hypothetical protein
MNTVNIAIIAALLTAIILGIMAFIDSIGHSAFISYFYFPAIYLAVAISGGSHALPDYAIWIGLVSYSLLYLLVFIVVYAVLLETYIVRGSLPLIDAAKKELVNEHPNMNKVLEHIGHAINEIESRRRSHYVLEASEDIDLSSPHHLLASDSLGIGVEHTQNRVVKAIVSHLKRRLGQHGMDADKTENLVSAVLKHAKNFRSNLGEHRKP